MAADIDLMVDPLPPPPGVSVGVWSSMSAPQQIDFMNQMSQNQGPVNLNQPLPQAPPPPGAENQPDRTLPPAPPGGWPAGQGLSHAAPAGMGGVSQIPVNPQTGITLPPAPPGGWPAGQGLSHAAPAGMGGVSQIPVNPQTGIPLIMGRGAAPMAPPPAPVAPAPAAPAGPPVVPYRAPDLSARGMTIPAVAPQTRTLVDPGALRLGQQTWGAAVAAKEAEANASDNLADTISGAGLMKQGAYQRLNQDQQKFVDDESRDATDLKEQARKHLEEADKFFDRIKNNRIDPDRYWSNMGFGRQLTMSLATGLSGLGQAFLGKGGNPVQDMLTQAIQRDVEAQAKDFTRDNENAKTVYATAFHLTGDAADARKLAMQFGFQAAAAKVEAIGAAADNDVLAARAQQASANLRTESKKIALEGIQDFIKNTKYSPGAPAGNILKDPRVQAWVATEAQKAGAEGRTVDPDELLKHAAEIYYPGSQSKGYANIAKPAKASPEDKAEEKETRNLQDHLNNLQELDKHLKGGGSLLYGEGATKLARAQASARATYGGRPPPQDVVERTLPSGTSLSDINANRLHSEMERTQTALNGRAGATPPGYKPAGQ